MSIGQMQRLFGQNLRKHRQAIGLSQEELGELLDMHRTYIGGVERGEKNLTLRTVETMCDRLNVPVVDLLFGHNDREDDSKE